MNKKPIKRNENIIKLSKEHHFTLLFCWKIRQGLKQEVDAHRMAKYVQYCSTNFLVPHFQEEELILFPLLQDAKVDKAIEQHKEINELVATLLNDATPQENEQLERLAQLLDNHVRYEERELFPYLERKLGKELDIIGHQLNSHGTMPKDEYRDEFWVKEK